MPFFLKRFPIFQAYDEGEELNLEDVTFVYADEASSCITSYEQLRQEALEDKAKKEKVLLNSAIDYTRRTFDAYMKEEHLNQLCDNIAIFQCCASTHMGHHSLIVDKAIRTIDLMHYVFVSLMAIEDRRFLSVLFTVLQKICLNHGASNRTILSNAWR